MTLAFAAPTPDAIPLHVIDTDALDSIPKVARAWADTNGFKAAAGSVLTIPNADGGIAMALIGNGTASSRKRGRFFVGAAAAKLPSGTYEIASGLEGQDLEEAALGWLLSSYTFDRYKAKSAVTALLVAPKGIDAARILAIANGEALTRDLINTPASDMGPQELEDATAARLLIPAVENSIDGNAFRPQDVLNSRKGLTVEINNTDAEGRLVLADALALADEENPDLVISMATLTGAARVAVGPDLSPFFTDSDEHAAALSASGATVADPVWRLPFHDPYEPMIEPDVADLDNAPAGGFAGAITAALFLRRFVQSPYMHFDVYGWNPSAKPARPKGGVGMGARAILDALPEMLDL